MWFCYSFLPSIHSYEYRHSHFWHDSQLAGLPKNFPEEGEEIGMKNRVRSGEKRRREEMEREERERKRERRGKGRGRGRRGEGG